MRFTKIHGCGNDYLYVDCITQPAPTDPEALARRISDRHFGVGSDGLILVLPSDRADLRMRMFNADGSEGEMCGNGVRGLARFAFDRRLATANPLRVETLRGVLSMELLLDHDKVGSVRVDMDQPILELARIPVDVSAVTRVDEHTYRLQAEVAGDREFFDVCLVSMGSAHAVRFLDADRWSARPITVAGPVLERHRAFPNRVNFHEAVVLDRQSVRMRTWERGSGVTLACGTGACAVVVAGVLTGRLERDVRVHLPGGDLRIEWRPTDDHVFMTGPSVEVFTGEWP